MNNPRKFLSYKTASNYNFKKNWNKIKAFLNDKEFETLCNKMIVKLLGESAEKINEIPLFDLGRYNEDREDMLDNLVFYRYCEEIKLETKMTFTSGLFSF